jgi:hypothetical protein
LTKSSRIFSVIFEVRTETERRRFNIPVGVTRLLGLRSKRDIALVIREAASGKLLYGGVQRLKSGTEIYGAEDVSQCLSKGKLIRVEASRTPG